MVLHSQEMVHQRVFGPWHSFHHVFFPESFQGVGSEVVLERYGAHWIIPLPPHSRLNTRLSLLAREWLRSLQAVTGSKLTRVPIAFNVATTFSQLTISSTDGE